MITSPTYLLHNFAEDVAVEKGGDQGAKKDCDQVAKKEVDQKAMNEVKEARAQKNISSGFAEAMKEGSMQHDIRFRYHMEPYQDDGWYKSCVEAEKTM